MRNVFKIIEIIYLLIMLSMLIYLSIHNREIKVRYNYAEEQKSNALKEIKILEDKLAEKDDFNKFLSDKIDKYNEENNTNLYAK